MSFIFGSTTPAEKPAAGTRSLGNRIAAGLSAPSEGRLRWVEVAVAAIGVCEVARRVAYPLVAGIVGGTTRAVQGRQLSRRARSAKKTELHAQVAEAAAWLEAQPPLTDEERARIVKMSAEELVAAQQQAASGTNSFPSAASPKAAKKGTSPTTSPARSPTARSAAPAGFPLTAVRVLQAFLVNALEAHEKTNCIVWLGVAEAVEAAVAADKHLSENKGKPMGALHGVPVSLKDCLALAGTDATLGMAARCGKPDTEDAASVKLLRDAGAILFVKTNVPQSMVSYECVNYVFGSGLNPYSPKHTCGGSSGGEAALIALRGSAMGVGTDVGGSIRIPAHFCGIYGFKPTSGRVPTGGNRPAIPGQEAVVSVAGPMANSMADLTTLFRVLIDRHASKYDGNVVGVAFQQQRYDEVLGGGKAKRTFGFYVDDGFVPASPACRRAVMTAVERLEAAGHRCVPLTMGGVSPNTVVTFYGLMAADGARTLEKSLGPEPYIPHIGTIKRQLGFPGWLRATVAFFARTVHGDAILGRIFSATKESTVQEAWRLQYERQVLRHAAASSMNEAGVDAVLCPGLVFPALPHGASERLSMGAMYTAVFNLLDLPACTVPVTTVDRDSDAWERTAPPKAAAPVVESWVRRAYDADSQHGLPVGVQVVGRRFDDEAVLACSRILDDALRAR